MNWKVKKVGVDIYAVMEGNNIIASVYSTMETNKPFGYNANLIASAPELLEACKKAEKTFRKISDPKEEIIILQYLRKVITKAEGK